MSNENLGEVAGKHCGKWIEILVSPVNGTINITNIYNNNNNTLTMNNKIIKTKTTKKSEKNIYIQTISHSVWLLHWLGAILSSNPFNCSNLTAKRKKRNGIEDKRKTGMNYESLKFISCFYLAKVKLPKFHSAYFNVMLKTRMKKNGRQMINTKSTWVDHIKINLLLNHQQKAVVCLRLKDSFFTQLSNQGCFRFLYF